MYQPYYQNTQPQFIVRQVTNRDEAKSFLIDPFSTYLFVDYSNGKIYMKRLNNNGLSDFYIFGVEKEKETKDPMTLLSERLTKLEKMIEVKNDKSVSGNAESRDVHAGADVPDHEESES